MAFRVLSINSTCIFCFLSFRHCEKYMRDLQTGARKGQMYQMCGFQQAEYPALEM